MFFSPQEKTARSSFSQVGHSLVYPLCILIKRSNAKLLFHNKADTFKEILCITNRFARKDTFKEAICNRTFAAKSSSKDKLNNGRHKLLTHSSVFSSSYDIFLQSCEGTWNQE